MMSDTLSPFGPSETYVCPPGYHPSIGHHGRILRYFWTISPWSLISTSVLYGFFFGWSSCCSPVRLKTPHVFAFLHAAPNASVSGPGIVVAVANISALSYMMPCVEYSGKTIRSMPGSPCFVPTTRSQMRSTFFITSSRVWSRGILYWKTHTPTVSGELEMSPWRDIYGGVEGSERVCGAARGAARRREASVAGRAGARSGEGAEGGARGVLACECFAAKGSASSL